MVMAGIRTVSRDASFQDMIVTSMKEQGSYVTVKEACQSYP